ncbi:helix-turn-helix domain-containing protein [Williamsia sp. 1135]|uniref:GlxA family transcriptional regulator n=1 Tax=Williamsia sp. 1135 TaxID=1889262 RepID=UPI000A1097D6|nr:helix-turn-helix domain-containing protein [Williamsia sp. 1135]ORM36547.1 AraC family transcriptional regulator [Williamsia sp. 1135]
MPTHSAPPRHRVVVLARDGLIPLKLGIPHRIFGQARSRGVTPLYDVITVTPAPGLIRTDTDFSVEILKGPEYLASADTVVIPASDEDYAAPTQGRIDQNLAEALSFIRPGTRMASICTGSFVLAAAGMLDGRRATTHWRSTDDFRRLFPHVTLDPNVLFTDCDNVLTSAGVAAGLDLCLHMVRTDHGSAVANDVARGTVTPPHREGGQAQYIESLVPDPRSAVTAAARAWALERLDQPIGLTDLAAVSAMSTRTFTRRFREETGLSPMQWLTAQRLDHARELLEQTDLPIDRVAAASGLGTAAALRQHFQSVVGVPPSAYRATFRGVPGDL